MHPCKMALNLCSFSLLPCKYSSTPLRRRLTSSDPRTPRAHVAGDARSPITAQIAAPSPPQRRSGVYQPDIWDNDYIQSLGGDRTIDETQYSQRIEVLKEEVRGMINKEKKVVDQLGLVDDLLRLGVAYHFEEEIKGVLGAMPASVENIRMVFKDDLRATALLFRILREHGLFVSQEIFDGFKDETGDFKTCLCEDTRGMLSLYEASYLAVKGDDTLDEARDFTTKHLKGLAGESLEPCLREHVAHALELPMNWRVPRVNTRWSIDVYERDESMNPILLEFAKLDFNMVQGIHQRELKEMSRWWKNLGLGEKLDFTRSRLMESFLFSVGWAFEPKFWKVREAGTKYACIVTTIDDIYDVHSSIDELELFTDAVERWDLNAMQQLPEFMKICYLALFNTINEFAYDVLRENGLDILPYLKKAWADQCNAYLVEAKWYHSRSTPTFKDYLDNAWISIGIPVILIQYYFIVSQGITNRAWESLKSYSNVIFHSSKIFRLSNDIGTSTAELSRGDVPKSIQCYMYENGVSEEVAREHIEGLLINTWKDLNGDRFAMSFFEEPLLNMAINFSRMSQCFYHNRDEFGKPDHVAKDRVMSLLIEPISLKMYI